MREVPQLISKAAGDLSDEPVHDLRVALRRCRSMADGFRAVDPDKSWKKMRRQATQLFDNLGALRDCHVMRQWVEELGSQDDPLSQRLAQHFAEQQSDLEQKASAAIHAFDLHKWIRWTDSLPRRTARLHPGSEVFQALALEKLNTARKSQSYALRTVSETALHRLRIALKKFRYVVENFLPQHHGSWKDGLKEVQDLLGEVHDLDMLRHALDQLSADADPESRQLWEKKLTTERTRRIERYCELVSGKGSLWVQWRSGLPQGRGARQASLKRLQAWSSFLDSDTQHSRRVARFAVQIRDGLSRVGVLSGDLDKDRELLRAAATAHEVGRAEGVKNHHKRSGKMISQIDHLPGWTRSDVLAMAWLARYHRGMLPQSAKMRGLDPEQRRRFRVLAGILRLANALDDRHDGVIHSVTVQRNNGFVQIHAAGLRSDSVLAETIAGARHLLEDACHMPVIVQPARK